MSPELLDPDGSDLKDGRATKESDCYALGMVIIEVLSGKAPFPQYHGMNLMKKIVDGERPGIPQGPEEVWFTNDLWGMLEQCWSPQPEERPTIKAVLQRLKNSSKTWQPLPPGSNDDVKLAGSDDQSHFTVTGYLSMLPPSDLEPYSPLSSLSNRPNKFAGWRSILGRATCECDIVLTMFVLYDNP